MAGIIKDDVFRAAQAIWDKEGKRPTQEAVRALLGRGSFATISKHLKEWREEYKDSLTAPEAEQTIPEEFIPMFQRFYNSVKANIEENAVTEQVRLLETENDRLQTELEDYRITKAQLSESSKMWERLIADKDTAIRENERLQKYAALADQIEEITQARDAAVQAVEALTAEKAELEDQKAELARVLAKNAESITSLEQQLKNSSQEVSRLVEENQQLSSEVEALQEQPKTEDAAESAEPSLSDESTPLNSVPEDAQPKPLPDTAPATPSAQKKRRQSRK